ncbi:MAG TPA: GNAT family N-acetyltransferase [Gemmatimonadaceae bacterium]
MITIRDAHPDEYGAMAALTIAAYSQYARIMAPLAWEGLDRAVRAALATTDPVERIVAESDGEIVGSVMLFPPAAQAYEFSEAHVSAPELRLLAVADAWRGKGIGEALVNECVRRARESGASELGLHTSVSMAGAMRLYKRMGFVRAPERDFQPPGTELVEGYRLPLR